MGRRTVLDVVAKLDAGVDVVAQLEGRVDEAIAKSEESLDLLAQSLALELHVEDLVEALANLLPISRELLPL